MRRDLYKYIVITFSIIVLWVGLIPLLFSRILPVICENLSYNTPFEIKIEKPVLYLNLIPVAYINAKNISVKSKNDDINLSIENLSLRIRILPLLSGRVHIDNISSDNVDLSAVLDENAIPDKKFITLLKNTKVICDSVDIKKISTKLVQKNSSKNALCKAENILFIDNGRYIKLNLVSEFNVNGAISKENINIYLPKNNNVKNSIINIHVKNLDIAPIADYLKNYLPKDFVYARGIVDADIAAQMKK